MAVAFKPRNLLIFGATGAIGSFITRSIVSARSEFERIAVFTSPPAAGSSKAAKLDELKAKGVDVIYGSIENEKEVSEAYKGIDTVVSALGRTAILHQIPLIKLAAASGSVKWFFPSEYGTDIKYNESSAHEKPHQGKLKVRAYLEEDPEVRCSGLAYTYVVTGPYADMYYAFSGPEEAGGFDVKAKRAVLVERNNRVSLTTMKDTGDFVLAALRHPETALNKALRVNSFTTTPGEILAEFERQTGGAPWTDVKETSLTRIRELEKESDHVVVILRRIWAEGGTLYEKRDNDLIGNPQTDTLQESVAEYIRENS